MLVPIRVYVTIFAIRPVVAPACASADPDVVGSGEKNGEGNFGTGTYVVLANGTNESRGHAIPSLEASCASIEVWKEYPLTPLVVRVACWMTASTTRRERARRLVLGLGKVRCRWAPNRLRECKVRATTGD